MIHLWEFFKVRIRILDLKKSRIRNTGFISSALFERKELLLQSSLAQSSQGEKNGKLRNGKINIYQKKNLRRVKHDFYKRVGGEINDFFPIYIYHLLLINV